MPHRPLPALVALTLVPVVSAAQAAPEVPPSELPTRRFQHEKEIRAVYDSVSDSTQVSVVTHGGRYFLWIQRPRLSWHVTYPGRAVTASSPDTVLLDFRTQNPQAAADSRLLLLFGEQGRAEVNSTRGWSRTGVQTNSHFMRFALPRALLSEALQHDRIEVIVGGVRVGFKRDQLEALRDLLSRTAPASG
jgi:hypothetical protein